MQQILTLFDTIAPVPEGLADYLQEHLQTRTFAKKEFLQRKGRYCNQIWFLETGIVGCFYEKSDKTLCAWFMKEGDLITSVPAFYQRIPAAESIRALDETSTYSLTYEQLQRCYTLFPGFNLHGRVLTEKYYVLAEERMRAFHYQRPLEKYRYLMEHFPELILRVSNTHLASYMGITLETLSRVKGRL